MFCRIKISAYLYRIKQRKTTTTMDKNKVISALKVKVGAFDFKAGYNFARLKYQKSFFHLFYIIETDEIDFRPASETDYHPYYAGGPVSEVFIGWLNQMSAANAEQWRHYHAGAIHHYLDEEYCLTA